MERSDKKQKDQYAFRGKLIARYAIIRITMVAIKIQTPFLNNKDVNPIRRVEGFALPLD